MNTETTSLLPLETTDVDDPSSTEKVLSTEILVDRHQTQRALLKGINALDDLDQLSEDSSLRTLREGLLKGCDTLSDWRELTTSE